MFKRCSILRASKNNNNSTTAKTASSSLFRFSEHQQKIIRETARRIDIIRDETISKQQQQLMQQPQKTQNGCIVSLPPVLFSGSTQKNNDEKSKSSSSSADVYQKLLENYFYHLVIQKLPVPFVVRYRPEIARHSSESQLCSLLHTFEECDNLIQSRNNVYQEIVSWISKQQQQKENNKNEPPKVANDAKKREQLLWQEIENATSLWELQEIKELNGLTSQNSNNNDLDQAMMEKDQKKNKDLVNNNKNKKAEQLQTKSPEQQEQDLIRELEAAKKEYFGEDYKEGEDDDQDVDQKTKNDNNNNNNNNNTGEPKSGEIENQQREAIVRRQMKKLEKLTKFEQLAAKLLGSPPKFERIDPSTDREVANKLLQNQRNQYQTTSSSSSSSHSSQEMYRVSYDQSPDPSAIPEITQEALSSTENLLFFADVVAGKILQQNPEFVRGFKNIAKPAGVFTLTRLFDGCKKMNLSPEVYQRAFIRNRLAVDFPNLIVEKIDFSATQQGTNTKHQGANHLPENPVRMRRSVKSFTSFEILALEAAQYQYHAVRSNFELNPDILKIFMVSFCKIFFSKVVALAVFDRFREILERGETWRAEVIKKRSSAGNFPKKFGRNVRYAMKGKILNRMLLIGEDAVKKRSLQQVEKSNSSSSAASAPDTFIAELALFIAAQTFIKLEQTLGKTIRTELAQKAKQEMLAVYKNQIMMMCLQKPLLEGTNEKNVMLVSAALNAPTRFQTNLTSMNYRAVVLDRRGTVLSSLQFTNPAYQLEKLMSSTDKNNFKNNKDAIAATLKRFEICRIGVACFTAGNQSKTRKSAVKFLESASSKISSTGDGKANNQNPNNNNILFARIPVSTAVKHQPDVSVNNSTSSAAVIKNYGEEESGENKHNNKKNKMEDFANEIHLARRILDPLSELSKIPALQLVAGLGNSLDLETEKLEQAVREEIESVIVNCGLVDMNTTSINVLEYVPGMTKDAAKRIVDYRSTVGAIRSRDEMRKVIQDNETWSLVAGFLRCSLSLEPFDRTSLHPAWYPLAKKICAHLGVDPTQLIVVDQKNQQNLNTASALLMTAQQKLSPSVRAAIAANELAKARATGASGGSSEHSKQQQKQRVWFSRSVEVSLKSKYPTPEALLEFKKRLIANDLSESERKNLVLSHHDDDENSIIDDHDRRLMMIVDAVIDELCLPQLDIRDHMPRGGLYRSSQLKFEAVEVGKSYEGYVFSVGRSYARVDIGSNNMVTCHFSDVMLQKNKSNEVNNNNDDEVDLEDEGAKLILPFTRVFVTITQKTMEQEQLPLQRHANVVVNSSSGAQKQFEGVIDLSDPRNLLRSNFLENESTMRVWDSFVRRKKQGGDDDEEEEGQNGIKNNNTCEHGDDKNFKENMQSQRLLCGWDRDLTSSSSTTQTPNGQTKVHQKLSFLKLPLFHVQRPADCEVQTENRKKIADNNNNNNNNTNTNTRPSTYHQQKSNHRQNNNNNNNNNNTRKKW